MSPEKPSLPSKRLSKSRYVAGLQCHKRLWWTVHEPDAPELEPDDSQAAILDRGARVGELAREHVPGGTLIDLPYQEAQARVAATRDALAAGARVVYEASFLEDGIFVSVDVLERRKRGYVLTEVKSTLKAKDRHLDDVAVQTHVVRRAGLPVKRAEVMHLNKECRHPKLDNLFVREAVTRRIAPHLRAVPGTSAAMLRMLDGPLPEVAVGPHCTAPYDCPFLERCSPALPAHHVSTLYAIRAPKVAELVARGVETIGQLPRGWAKSGPAKRQVKSVKESRVVVAPGLRRAMRALKLPIAFLDFETLTLAVPVWPGCRPYDQLPVQFSCHVLGAGDPEHHVWLGEGPADNREALARALIAACSGAATVVAYNAPFERRCIEGLIEAFPKLKAKLRSIIRRLRDLLPIVRDNVYHPDFGGSFSIKSTLPALVPGFGYDDLEIHDGATASAALETVLFGGDTVGADERAKLRADLLRYCERDTLAMVRLYERLREIRDGERVGGG